MSLHSRTFLEKKFLLWNIFKTRNDLPRRVCSHLYSLVDGSFREAVFAITEVDLKCEYRNSDGNLVSAFCMEAVVIRESTKEAVIESGCQKRS